MDVAFFIPPQYLPDTARLEAWKSGAAVAVLPAGKAATVEAWIVQTALRLAAAGFPARLVTEFPPEGIVVALAGNLAPGFRKPPETFLVGVAADGLPHPAADFHVVQNAAHARRLPRCAFMPHWPQPGLMPRDPERGLRFERIGFFGDPANLDPELRAEGFRTRLRSEVGLEFETIPPGSWADYRAIDAALAIRSFGRKRFLSKPATKMTNAWLAGVPFLGGPETSFRAVGNPGGDYLLCCSSEELRDWLARLRSQPLFRERLVAAGANKAAAYGASALLDRWTGLLERVTRTLPVRGLGRVWNGFRIAVDRLLLD